MLCVLSAVSLGERVELDPEGDALLAAVLPGGELCADAVHLRTRERCVIKTHCILLKWKIMGAPNRWHKRELVCVCVWVGYLHKDRGSFVHVPQELCCI